MTKSQTLRRETRAVEAYQALRQRILDGTVSPGERLTETALSAQFGMSRIPVREALNRLQAEGLVRSAARRGYVVPVLSRREMEDLFDARLALESYVAGRIADRITPAAVRALDELCDAREDVIRRADVQEFLKLGRQFHVILDEACGNTVILRMLQLATNPYFEIQQYRSVPLDVWWQLNGEHRLLVDALREGLRERVHHTLMAHMHHVRTVTCVNLD